MRSQSCDLIVITKYVQDSSWMPVYFFRKDRPARGCGGVAVNMTTTVMY